MERAIDEEADRAGLPLDNLAAGVSRDRLTVDEAQISQVLVDEDVAVRLLVVRLDATEIRVRAFLNSSGQLVGEVAIDLVLHVFGEDSRELLEGLLEAAVLLHSQLVSILADVQLFVNDPDAEFLLVDIRLSLQSKGHVREAELAHAPLFDDLVRLDLEPLIEFEYHRDARHLDRHSEVGDAIVRVLCDRLALEIHCEVRVLKVEVGKSHIFHE